MKKKVYLLSNYFLLLTLIAMIDAEEYVISPDKMTWEEAVKVSCN